MADNNDFDDFDDGSPMDYYSDIDNSDPEDHLEPRESNCAILKEADICECMDHEITELSSVLSISKLEASLLLRHYNWSVSKVHDGWFADEFGVRKKVGLLLEKPKEKQVSPDDLTCGICFESYSHDLIKSVSCCHPFCSECWGLYIHSNVNDGPGCLLLRCPEPTCVVAVADDVVNELAFEEDKRKYYHYLARSYVESNKKRKWCPAPGCDYAIDFVGCDGNFDVTCVCSHSFCFNCCEERHRPVGCDTVSKWNLKNSSDSQNETWKKAYTKPCPKCQRPIEKNAGCMRMACSSPCKYVFCWICLKDWSTHGYHGSCNRYIGNPQPEETSTLRQELLKYQHYYDRWAANEKSRQIALADLERVQENHIKVIAKLYGQPQTQLEFLTEAWQQIVECRRVLKWTYAYGYYLPEDEDAKVQLFEYLQGQAESSLERLHDCAERELKIFLDCNKLSEGFNDFQKKLTHLTGVTKNYFENLVTALENGLSDVASCSKQQKNSIYRRLKVPVENSYKRMMTTPEERSSYLYTALTRTRANRDNTQAQRNTMGAALVTPTQTKRKIADNVTPHEGEWSCKICTYMNPGTAEICEACKRGAWICQYCTYANRRTATACQMCAEDQ